MIIFFASTIIRGIGSEVEHEDYELAFDDLKGFFIFLFHVFIGIRNLYKRKEFNKS